MLLVGGGKMNVINQDPQNPNNYIPYVLLEIFSKTNIDFEIQNKEHMLQVKKITKRLFSGYPIAQQECL